MTRQVQMLSVMNTLSQRTVCECVLAEHVCTCTYVCVSWVDGCCGRGGGGAHACTVSVCIF